MVASEHIKRGETVEISIARRIEKSNHNLEWIIGQYLFADRQNNPDYSHLVLGLMSLANHSDTPNGMLTWVPIDENLHEVELVANRDIEPDEEITISYIDIDAYPDRHSFL